MELSPKAANQRQTTYIITGAASFALMYHQKVLSEKSKNYF
jgi:hypothetical protein